MSTPNYFKLGIFVVIGSCIFTVLIVIFGAGKLFQKRVIIETYFEESVQGLEVGSPIKFRGVHVGKVESISMAATAYETQTRLIMVRSSLLTEKFPFSIEEFLEGELIYEINKGLRIRLTFKGITGTAYLEMDYLPPKRHKILQIDWKPTYPYVPSTPSVITRISDAISSILLHIKKINFFEITRQFGATLNTMQKIVETAHLKNMTQEATLLLSELRETNQHLQMLLNKDALHGIIEETQEMMASARRITRQSEKPIAGLLVHLTEAAKELNQATEKIRSFSNNLPESSIQFQRTLRRLDSLLFVQQDDIEKTVDNIRLITENLKELTENAKKYPSQFIFGAPPAHSRP
ncbi:MAG: ABC transport system substrate-binding protein, partial [Candidatus Magnetoglobus multicellularis str. Araruama]